MNAHIVLDSPPGSNVFTNLDIISGKVILRLPKPGSITQIVVKLEGESNSVLEEDTSAGQRGPQVATEKHRILYRIERVFPPNNDIDTLLKPKAFALQPGIYEYPFTFKLPINNMCETNNQHVGVLGVALAGYGGHVKTTLPPSFSYTQQAGIYYYVKCTVSVPSLFRENPRVATFFHFCPIEPPRKPGDGECFARRPHNFFDDLEERKAKSFGGMFQKKKTGLPSPTSTPVRILIDARIPNPAVLSCGSKVPLRLLVTNQTSRKSSIYLQSLQIEVIGFTKIRASQFAQVRTHSWIITSLSNLQMEIGNLTDPVDTITEIPNEHWADFRLPDTVCPSFRTCNLERSYEISATLGLTYGSTEPGLDQFISLKLRHKVEILSGIAPPPELLRRASDFQNENTLRPSRPARRPVPVQSQSHSNVPTTPTNATFLSQEDQPLQDHYAEPPPSYEDAIAENIRPVETGPRQSAYRPPAPSMKNIWNDSEKN